MENQKASARATGPTTVCQSEEIALKSFFLGPQAENAKWVQYQIEQIFLAMFGWRRRLRPEDGAAISEQDQQVAEFQAQQQHTEDLLTELSRRFEAEIPKFSPRYIGHMFSEISLPALFGHVLTLLHNPNNISAESAPVGVQIENEALAELSNMLGWPEAYGHFTSGGTIANYEMLFRARADAEARGHQLDQCVLIVPAHKHYSWVKGAYVFGVRHLWTVPLDESGHMNVEALGELLQKAHAQGLFVMGVVSVLGTTEMGLLDPIHRIADLLEAKTSLQGRIWHHIDAAYGAFFRCLLVPDATADELQEHLSPQAQASLRAVERATSVTLDPHKLGYVPYASGVFLCREKNDYTRVAFGAPYVNFSEQKDKGLFTLEGSRSATGAAATWMTAKAVGFNQRGYGRILARGIRLRRELEQALIQSGVAQVAPGAETNLLCFCLGRVGDDLEQLNRRSLKFYSRMNQADSPFFVSKTKLSLNEDSAYASYLKAWLTPWVDGLSSGRKEGQDLVLIRLTLMNPFLGSRELKRDLIQDFVAEVVSEFA